MSALKKSRSGATPRSAYDARPVSRLRTGRFKARWKTPVNPSGRLPPQRQKARWKTPVNPSGRLPPQRQKARWKTPVNPSGRLPPQRQKARRSGTIPRGPMPGQNHPPGRPRTGYALRAPRQGSASRAYRAPLTRATPGNGPRAGRPGSGFEGQGGRPIGTASRARCAREGKGSGHDGMV